MTIRAVAISLAFVCNLAACAPSRPEPTPDQYSLLDDVPPPASVERLITPTPAMRDAALAGDTLRMKEAAANLLGCQSPSTCPGEFASCTNWSAGNVCDTFCEWSPICRCVNGPFAQGAPGGGETNARECGPEDTEFRFRNTLDSFRICFNPAQQACTEWRNQSGGGGCNC